MPGIGRTKQALRKLEEVRNTIREAEVELRDSAYYRSEARHRLSEAVSGLAAAERALRSVLEALEAPGETPPEPPTRPPTRTGEGKEREVIQRSIFPTKILLATDGSGKAALATRWAVCIAAETGSELHVAYAAPVPFTVVEFKKALYLDPFTKRLRYVEDVEKAVKDEAQRFLDGQVERARAVGGTVTQAHVRLGRPDEQIVVLAADLNAGLVVVGSRGLGRLSRTLMGSVSDSVVRHAHCPVLVVRGEKGEEPVLSSKRILLATDGSEEAALAARAAVDLAEKTGSEVHVVHVRARIVPHYPGYYVGPEVAEHAQQKERERLDREAQRLLDAQVDEIEAAGGSVAQAHLRIGKPDEEIVVLGEELEADLIVVGNRGRGGVRRALMGSVSDSVVRHARSPVLVMRRRGAT